MGYSNQIVHDDGCGLILPCQDLGELDRIVWYLVMSLSRKRVDRYNFGHIISVWSIKWYEN